jgi:triacylglycerol lipase
MLVFADSAYLGEWLAAISSLDQRAPFGTGEVLSQVSQGYLAIRKALWELLSSHSNKAGSTLWLTGHGVGGALAMMAAADFVIEEHPFTGLVSLGNPRFVDRDS